MKSQPLIMLYCIISFHCDTFETEHSRVPHDLLTFPRPSKSDHVESLSQESIDITVDSGSLFDLRVILEEASPTSNRSISDSNLAETVKA
jgi:hypothetical protein